jgi:hypothetical protein
MTYSAPDPNQCPSCRRPIRRVLVAVGVEESFAPILRPDGSPLCECNAAAPASSPVQVGPAGPSGQSR